MINARLIMLQLPGAWSQRIHICISTGKPPHLSTVSWHQGGTLLHVCGSAIKFKPYRLGFAGLTALKQPYRLGFAGLTALKLVYTRPMWPLVVRLHTAHVAVGGCLWFLPMWKVAWVPRDSPPPSLIERC